MPRLLHYSDIENVYDDADRAARLAGLVQSLDGDDAVVCGTGDNTAPGVLALVERGRQSLEFFDAVDADLDTFGNHDFDFGPDATRGIVADAPQTWVSANVRDENGDPFGADEGVVPWTTVETADGTVGFFGLTDPATDSLNPQAADLTFTDPLEAAERAVAALRPESDYVVCLSHLGAEDDAVAALDVDVVLGGHVHTERFETVDGTLCTRPGANGEVLVEVILDDRGPRAVRHETAAATPDPSLASALRGRIDAAALDEVVAHASTPLRRDAETVTAGECRIGNFVADAYRAHFDADVGLQNSGGIRAGPPLHGDVTVSDVIGVVPFEEPVVLAEVTGEELLEAFRQASGTRVDFGEPEWWHAHVSGATLVWDDDRDELVAAAVDDAAVAPGETYTVALPEYLLHSDHEFPAIGVRHRVGEGDIQHDVLVDHARDHGVDVDVEGRIERRVARERPASGGDRR